MSGLGVTVKKLFSKVYLNYYVVCDTLDLKRVGEFEYVFLHLSLRPTTDELYEHIKG